MPLMHFNEITQQSDAWNKWDSLNGVKLVDGQRLWIRWPDGIQSIEPIKIGTSHVPVGPLGSDHSGTFKTVQFAYVIRIVRGVKTWVHLLGLKAKPSCPHPQAKKKKR